MKKIPWKASSFLSVVSGFSLLPDPVYWGCWKEYSYQKASRSRTLTHLWWIRSVCRSAEPLVRKISTNKTTNATQNIVCSRETLLLFFVYIYLLFVLFFFLFWSACSHTAMCSRTLKSPNIKQWWEHTILLISISTSEKKP